jgi:hypothetical protein
MEGPRTVMKNKIVLHFLDGKILKGTTSDFSEEKGWFSLTKRKTEETIKVELSQLKGIFFVKSFDGNREYCEREDMNIPGLGKKVVVTFKDGERLCGHVPEEGCGRAGFFLHINAWRSNNEKVFVLNAATEKIDQDHHTVELKPAASHRELIRK